MTAVNESGSALNYASELFRDDKEIVLKAVQNDGSALEYATQKLQNDEEVVRLSL
jgi:hypothetical protein